MSFINFAAALLVTYLVIILMVVGKPILLPLVIAIFFWYLITALAQGYKHIPPLQEFRKFRLALATITFIVVIWTPIELISNTVPVVVKAAPHYQANLEKLITNSFAFFGVDHAPIIRKISDSINLGTMAKTLAGGLADFAGNAIMIIIYMAFLFVEQGSFSKKITAISAQNSKKIRGLIDKIYRRIQKYLWIKTMTSIATGLISYAIMKIIGLDFAEFWALLIFFLNYIPSVGGILATVFPALLALVQFDGPQEFFLIAVAIAAIQFTIGNVIEPRIMGSSLNLSPLIIILSLVVWGTIWGIAGMFLCVPLTVILMVVFSEFKKTKSIAIILSADGKIG